MGPVSAALPQLLCKKQPGAHVCASQKCHISSGMTSSKRGSGAGAERPLSLLHLAPVGGERDPLPTEVAHCRTPCLMAPLAPLPHCPLSPSCPWDHCSRASSRLCSLGGLVHSRGAVKEKVGASLVTLATNPSLPSGHLYPPTLGLFKRFADVFLHNYCC